MKKFLYTFVLFGTVISGIQAQQGVLTASGDAIGSNGNVSYSIGQIAYLTLTDTNGLIIQGVQQPYEIQFLPGINEPAGLLQECSLFPNPTDGEITLKIESWTPGCYVYRLTDARGIVLSEQPVGSCLSPVHMESFPSGTYLITIICKETILGTYKIIKR